MHSSAYMTPQAVAELLGLDDKKVLGWIADGSLPAFNVAKSTRGERPRWRIAKDDLQNFLAARRSSPPPVTQPRRTKLAGVRQYY